MSELNKLTLAEARDALRAGDATSVELTDACLTEIDGAGALNAFAPDLLIISAGFDAHARDPLANVNLSAHDFDWVTAELMSCAEKRCDNRVVGLLEGGYDLQGLAESCAAHVKRLMTG